jgi:predicted 3-demethylubiquinone-9 3-methyltransferase (glyoxalase superfamily)
LLDGLLGEPEAVEEAAAETQRDLPLPEAFQVVIECRDEAEQQAVFERLTGDGYTCRLLTL